MTTKDKFFIGLIIILVLALCVETAYVLQLQSDIAFNKILSTNKELSPQDDKEQMYSDLFNNEINKLFQQNFVFSYGLNSGNAGSEIIEENEKEYIVKIALPNMENKKINVQVEGNSLIISAESNSQKENKNNNNFYHSEHSFSTFKRIIPLPEEVDSVNVKTEYENGTLSIKLPKITIKSKTIKL